MTHRFLARRRLTIRYWASWSSTSSSGRHTGPRPILALHRLPDPNCRTCGGRGEVMCGVYGQEEPDYDDCDCAPFLPLAHIWLPKPPAWTRRLRSPAARRGGFRPADTHDQPPF
ncbi:hypothetical protein [Streptomyces huiliensis]|uniref:hypothetical protein n=1 Tax=Streptomyces huiliensis TaxID=2876027 RepID=UPI001CBBD56A|nr:hypothetical protein [Streptomyces huiliensis]MBZ4319408.1 hypothetical protein [Streptomyces huiliensis]